jgi:hypothetical protein
MGRTACTEPQCLYKAALLLPAACLSSFFRSHLQAGLYFLKKAMSTIDSTIIGAETCGWQ